MKIKTMGMSEFIEAHDDRLSKTTFDEDFLDFHLDQIRFLQHERLAHLLVMLFVILAFLTFFILFLLFKELFIFGLFLICLILTVFYVFHYYKLENTVIKWYFIYDEKKIELMYNNPLTGITKEVI